MRINNKQIGRFEKCFSITPGCWIWGKNISKGGYGQFSLNDKTVLAHRVSYKIYIGNIPDGLQVCHKCDNRRCVNPNHFFLGTAKDNADDRNSKGRHVISKGIQHGGHKLTEEEVCMIKFAKGSQKEIALAYGVTQGTVHNIKRGKNWTHLNLLDPRLETLVALFGKLDDRGQTNTLALLATAVKLHPRNPA